MTQFIAYPRERIKTDKIGLIDADYIKYIVINKIIKSINNGDCLDVKDTSVLHHRTEATLNKEIFEKIDAKGFIFCFSGFRDYTFRNYIAFDKNYKGTRSTEVKYDQELDDKTNVVKYIRERYNSIMFKDLEADDLLCMLQDKDTFILSEDKDMLQIPGTHFDKKKDEFYEISQEQACSFLMEQMILGDTVDNISGLKGYGEVKAKELLTNIKPQQMVYQVLSEYMKVNGYFKGLDMFIENYNLLKLRLNRGDHFISKYKSAFDTLRMIKLNNK